MRIGTICAAMLAACALGGAGTGRADEAVAPLTPQAGLWQISKTAPEIQGGTRTFSECFDSSFEATLKRLGADPRLSQCTGDSFHRDGNKVTRDMACSEGPSKVASHLAATLDGDSAFHLDLTTHYDPPLMGQATSARALDAKWLGPCRTGMQPGDVLLPDGRIFNLDVLRQRGFSKSVTPPS